MMHLAALGSSALLGGLAAKVPVDPDADQARRWIVAELSKPEYQAAQPTLFDRVSAAFWDWLTSLDLGNTGLGPGPLLVIITVLLLAGIIAAYFIFGAPRLNRRSRAAGVLFGVDDDRDAAAMRAAAQAAAGRAQWSLAISEMFRALARGLAERTIVSVSPGTTARTFADTAGHAFPTLDDRLQFAAAAFDEVRYLGRPGTEEAFRQVADLERELAGARPQLNGLPR
ncbi:DUF4129 domain-containing protein [Parafrigoribacterium mesophilum]|uniref:DUF4129 domain-containing protein n=1 Tax=Parafrigoribacterium mesophilum TaxID=433646 RepID=UPI0031FCCBDC